jgi:hypothetical protein
MVEVRFYLRNLSMLDRLLAGLTQSNLETNLNVGLQCHTAPFSWKLVFEYDHQLFEITMSACSPKEELEWRSRLTDHSCRETLDPGEQALFTCLSLAIKPMGTVFGKPGQSLQARNSLLDECETRKLCSQLLTLYRDYRQKDINS